MPEYPRLAVSWAVAAALCSACLVQCSGLVESPTDVKFVPLGRLLQDNDSVSTSDNVSLMQLNSSSFNFSQANASSDAGSPSAEPSGPAAEMSPLVASELEAVRTELGRETRQRVILEASLTKQLAGLTKSVDTKDTAWVLYISSLVTLWQLGLALLATGSVRRKNIREILMKNLLGFSVGIVALLFGGFRMAHKEFGWTFFDNDNLLHAIPTGRDFLMQTVLTSTCIALVSAAMAERTTLGAHLGFSVLVGTIFSAVVFDWTRVGGWLTSTSPPFQDTTGGGVIHAAGGAAALAGAIVVGPRTGRFAPVRPYEFREAAQERGSFRDKPENLVMGTLILWLCWLVFNCQSTGTTGIYDGKTSTVAFVNTLVSPQVSAIVGVALGALHHHLWWGIEEDRPPKFDMRRITSGLLGGLVGITAGCDNTAPEWAAAGTGVVSGIVAYVGSEFITVLRIDDAVDAVAVHGICGFAGLICVGLFDADNGFLTRGRASLFFSQFFAGMAIFAFASVTSLVYFGVCQAYGILRVGLVVELMGSDRYHFEEDASRTFPHIEDALHEKWHHHQRRRIHGNIWGIKEQTAEYYVLLHRQVTNTFLFISILWTFVFYSFISRDRWVTQAGVGLACGCQSIAGAYAEFTCLPGDLRISVCVSLVIFLGLGLSAVNFVVASENEDQDIIKSWFWSWSLLPAWCVWMRLCLHPVDWEELCFCAVVRHSRFPFLRSILGVAKASSWSQLILGLFAASRIQHILETLISMAAFTANIWVGCDDFGSENSSMIGLIVLGLCLVRLPTLLSRLIARRRRSHRNYYFFATGTSFFFDGIIAALILWKSESELWRVSTTLFFMSMLQQLFVTFSAHFFFGSLRKNKGIPQAIDVPCTTLKSPDCLGALSGELDERQNSRGGKSENGQLRARQDI
mmetsp:Transcript_51374/g.111454  ORF Transcript_51374/g.111454 Transcript_51374/m.111454 type:complete len:913 (+) Transcript_51374:34-2772(+)